MAIYNITLYTFAGYNHSDLHFWVTFVSFALEINSLVFSCNDNKDGGMKRPHEGPEAVT
jgi:hypothetical protein